MRIVKMEQKEEEEVLRLKDPLSTKSSQYRAQQRKKKRIEFAKQEIEIFEENFNPNKSKNVKIENYVSKGGKGNSYKNNAPRKYED